MTRPMTIACFVLGFKVKNEGFHSDHKNPPYISFYDSTACSQCYLPLLTSVERQKTVMDKVVSRLPNQKDAF